MSGAQAIVNCLLEQGVSTVFGYPGGSILPLYDALYQGPIHHVLTVHEQGAVHAADGYARASGKAGVCLATSGPGATNLITGLATAYLDSVPVIAITGQVGTAFIGRDSFQETDMVSLTLAITKHNFLVTKPQNLVPTLRRAFTIALSGRPGPVLIDIPVDIQKCEVDWEPLPQEKFIQQEQGMDGAEKNLQEGLDKAESDVSPDLFQAINIIEAASQPVILVGGGVIRGNATAAVADFSRKYQAPIVATLMGIGAVPSSQETFLGLTGLHGHKQANRAIQEADLLIAIGCRFSDRLTGKASGYHRNKKVIHIDIDQTELDKNVAITVGLAGPIEPILNELCRKIAARKFDAWRQRVTSWQEISIEYDSDSLSASQVFQYLNKVRQGKETLYVTDVGQNQMWAAQNLKIEKPRQWITSGGFGTMGFGLPAAIGAAFACPNTDIIHLAGDGAFKMTGTEWFTAVREGKRLISIIFDNGCLGMVRQLQTLFYEERYAETTIGSFDFQQFVGACGVTSAFVKTLDEFAAAYEQAQQQTRGMVIIVKIPPEELVFPMLRPGGALGEYVEVSY
ncbi:MAG: biosynthetic-type acetolactate synthase large subunit [Sporomusaceae bacterium]|nr:biosynthetic-type acetolactate synthase large subunit [Sporomusaceae bacterium]